MSITRKRSPVHPVLSRPSNAYLSIFRDSIAQNSTEIRRFSDIKIVTNEIFHCVVLGRIP